MNNQDLNDSIINDLNSFFIKSHTHNLPKEYVDYFYTEIPKIVQSLKSNKGFAYYSDIAKDYDKDVEARKMSPDDATYSMQLIKNLFLLTAKHYRLNVPTLPSAEYSLSNKPANVKVDRAKPTPITSTSTTTSTESNVKGVYNTFNNPSVPKNKYDVNNDSAETKAFEKTDNDANSKLFTLGNKPSGPQTVYPNPSLVNNKNVKTLTNALGASNMEKMYDVTDQSGKQVPITSHDKINRVEPITFREPLDQIDKSELQKDIYKKGKIQTK